MDDDQFQVWIKRDHEIYCDASTLDSRVHISPEHMACNWICVLRYYILVCFEYPCHKPPDWTNAYGGKRTDAWYM
jgi:hypothetical protein